MNYKIKVFCGKELEVVEGDWPNQRDALKFAKAYSVLANTGTPIETTEAEILEPAGLSHGGARPGAGRPRLTDEPTIEATITLPTSLDAKAQQIGGGNRSAGIRLALEAFGQ